MNRSRQTNLLRAELAEEEGRAVHEAVVAAKAGANEDLTAVGAGGAEIDDHEASGVLQHGGGVAAEELRRQLLNVVLEDAVAQLGFVLRGDGGGGGQRAGERGLDVRRARRQTLRGALGFKLSW